MPRFSNGHVSLGDPIQIRVYTIKNLRGDYRYTWLPATVAQVQPMLVAAVASGELFEIHNHNDYRIPNWAVEKYGVPA